MKEPGAPVGHPAGNEDEGTVMSDGTEAARREMIPTMPAELQRVLDAGEPVWTTEEMTRDFEVLGFAAPLVVVRRRSDGVRGSLEFCHSPRHYFNFEPG